jgi:hypothetical protein
MNRIILVGNGFDLAHGYKTSYEDFIVWYFKKYINEFEGGNKSIESKLFKLSWVRNKSVIQGKKFSDTFSTISELKKNTFIGINTSQGKIIRIDLHSTFFYELLEENNWTDIESYYFKELVNIHSRSHEYSEIKDLNDFLTNLQHELADYLIFLTKEKVTSEFQFLTLLNNINVPHDNNTFLKLYP